MSFIKREGNNTAPVLAKFATKNDIEKVWVHPPECIHELLLLLLEQFALAV
jgi:hypothetical protein